MILDNVGYIRFVYKPLFTISTEKIFLEDSFFKKKEHLEEVFSLYYMHGELCGMSTIVCTSLERLNEYHSTCSKTIKNTIFSTHSAKKMESLKVYNKEIKT